MRLFHLELCQNLTDEQKQRLGYIFDDDEKQSSKVTITKQQIRKDKQCTTTKANNDHSPSKKLSN